VGVEPAPLSANNPRLITLRRLSGRRRARLDAGAFVLEGPVPVGEALAAGATLDEVFVDAEAWADAEPGSALREAVEAAATAGTPVWSLGRGVLAKAADTVTPQGLLAVAPRRPVELAALVADAERPGPILVLVDVGDPGNAGTLVRAAEAAGGAGVVFAGSSTDPFGPKAVRAAAGSVLRLPVAEAPDTAAALDLLRTGGRRLVATVAAGGAAPEALRLTGPVAVLVGSEAHGLPDDVVAAADDLLTIPLDPGVESLNAAVAGAVVLFEVARQRRAGGPGTDWTTDRSTDRLGDR
jgi:TrmH family RNA methyltransferase